MSINDRVNPDNLSESEIDQIVIAQAEDDSAWDEPIEVRKKSPTAVSLPAELTARAAFLAKSRTRLRNLDNPHHSREN